jgi:hypothetical protein
LRADKWWFASILCRITSESPSSGLLHGLDIVSRFVLPYSLDVSDPFVPLIARHLTISIVIFKALMNFNPRAAFVDEKLDHVTLFNQTNNALLMLSMWSPCYNLRGHWEHQTNFNQQQTTDVRFPVIWSFIETLRGNRDSDSISNTLWYKGWMCGVP